MERIPVSKKVELISMFVCILYFANCNCMNCLKSLDCRCEFGPQGGVIIDCSGKRLTTIPSFELTISAEIYEIILKDNNIAEIPSFSFNRTSLKKLDLTSNPLTVISSQAFSGVEQNLNELLIGSTSNHTLSISSIPLDAMINLERLTISHFNDVELHEHTLQNLKKLKDLSLLGGYLGYIYPSAFSGQGDVLERLDLSGNRLKEVPSVALSQLKNVGSLSLSSNNIKTFSDGAFETLKKLKILNISHLNGPQLDRNAFRGLENSLEILNLVLSRLTDNVLESISLLKSLTHLHASYNEFTQPHLLLDGSLKQLKFVDLQSNKISEINRLESKSLQTLILESNPITVASADAFYHLPSLLSLNLNNAKALNLDENTFVSQASTLKELRINEVDLSRNHWQALVNLKAIETLEASKCNFSNIQDFMFRFLNNLKTLILEENDIASITQRSFYGLSNSLQVLSLRGNKLTTVNECVFYDFEAFNLAYLSLDRNPLNCDCEMQWLFEKIESLKARDEMKNMISLLQWRCHDLDVDFNKLTAEHFKECPPRAPPTCEEFVQFSTTERPTPGAPDLFLVDIRSDAIVVSWNVSSKTPARYILSYEEVDDKTRVAHAEVESQASEHRISNLNPSTTYKIYFTIVSEDRANQTVHLTVTTVSWFTDNKQIVIGCAVGGCLVLLILLILIILICIGRRKPSVPIVEITEQSKRYVKHLDYSSSGALRPYRPASHPPSGRSDANDIIKSTLDTMSEEEKYRLVNLLTNSRGSIDDLDEGFFHKQSYGDAGKLPVKHVYEEIPNDIYDEIAEDNTV